MAVRALPKLRDDVVVIEQVVRGERMYVYKVTETGDYYHLDPVQHAVLSLLDGRRTAEEVLDEFHRRNPDRRMDLPTLEEHLEGFRGAELFEVSREERRRALLETIRDRRKARAAHRSKYGSLFEITLPAWNPNNFFGWAVPRLWFFFTPAFVWFSLACIAAMLIIWGYRWQEIQDGTLALFSFANRTAVDVLQFYLIIFVIGFLHESSHGLTCKYFGGNVTQMGLLFLFFTPCFYVDVSDAYLLDSHFKRQWIIFAGGYFETFLCALATFVWAVTQPGTLVNEVSYKMLVMMGLASVIINYNPLIKLDGYYSLMDWLEIPDLSERASAYVSGWFRKNLFRLPAQLEIVSRRVRRIFLTYGILSFVYKISLIVFFLVFLRNVFMQLFGALGFLLFIGLAFLMFRNYLRKLYTGVKFFFLDKREVLMTRRSLAILGGTAGLVLLGVFVLRLPVSVKGSFALEPGRTAAVRAAEEGWVEAIRVREGQRVSRDEPVAVLRNEDLTRELQKLKQRLALKNDELVAAAGSGRTAEMARVRRERDRLADEEREFRRRVQELVLRAPLDGVVITARLHDLQGIFLREGEAFCEVADPASLIARVPVMEYRLEEVAPGQEVDLKLLSYPFRTLPGRVVALAPASGGPVARRGGLTRTEIVDFDAVVRLLDSPEGIRAGMAGTARIRVGRATVAGRTARALRRWYGSRVW